MGRASQAKPTLVSTDCSMVAYFQGHHKSRYMLTHPLSRLLDAHFSDRGIPQKFFLIFESFPLVVSPMRLMSSQFKFVPSFLDHALYTNVNTSSG